MAKKIINVVYDVNDKELLQAKKVIQDTEKETKKAEGTFKKMGQTGSQAFTLIGGIAATLGLAALGKQVFAVTSEFQKLAAVLTNTLGSRSLAMAALNDIRTFASQTPFSVQELTASFVKLANQGFKPTLAELRKLGDIASSQGKQFDQLTEAIIDAQTGEFERLKEFGIRASKEGENVRFTFKGVQTQTQFTNDAIREYILSLGDLEGVSGSMAAISGTLGGQLSNLGDSFDSLFNALGEASNGIISYVLSQLNAAASTVAEILNAANRDVFSDNRSKRVKEEFENFQKLTKSGQAEEINKIAQEVQYWRNELALLEKAFAVNAETGLNAQQKLEKAAGILNLSVEDTIDLFKNQNFELEATKSNVIETEELFKLFINTYNKAETATNKVTTATKKLKKEIRDLGDIKPDDTAKKISDVFDKVYEETEGKQRKSLDRINSTLDKHVEKFIETEQDKADKVEKIREEAARKEEERQRRIYDLSFELGQALVENAIMQRQVDISGIQEYYDNQLRLAGDNEKAKEQIELERDKKLRVAEEKNKEIQKRNARSKILIDTAVAIIKTFAEFGYPAGILPAALMTGISVVQLANVKKFKKGQVNINGPGTGTSDSIPAMISNGESVINAKATSQSKNLLEAINDRKIDDRILTAATKNGGSQVNVFDDSRIIAELQKGRVDYEVHGTTLYKSQQVGRNFKRIMRAKNQGY